MSDTQEQVEVKPINTDGMRVFVRTDSGKYNFLNPSEIKHLVELQVTTTDETIRISETWPEDEDPYVSEDMPPSEVLDILEARSNSHWISTSREANKVKTARIRAVMDKVDIAWAERRIDSLEQQIESRSKNVKRLRNLISDILEDAE